VLDDVESVEAGHLHVEEHQVGHQRIERGEHLSAVAAFADDPVARVRGEQLAHAAPGRRLVIGDEDAAIAVAWLVDGTVDPWLFANHRWPRRRWLRYL
jgi:hypothetical protein